MEFFSVPLQTTFSFPLTWVRNVYHHYVTNAREDERREPNSLFVMVQTGTVVMGISVQVSQELKIELAQLDISACIPKVLNILPQRC